MLTTLSSNKCNVLFTFCRIDTTDTTDTIYTTDATDTTDTTDTINTTDTTQSRDPRFSCGNSRFSLYVFLPFLPFFYRFTGLLFRVVSYAFPYVSYTLSSHPIPFSYVFSVRTYVRLSWLRLVAIQQPRIAECNVVARSTRSAHSARV